MNELYKSKKLAFQCYIISTIARKGWCSGKWFTFLTSASFDSVPLSASLTLMEVVMLLLVSNKPVFMFACVYCNMHSVTPHQHKGPVMWGLPHKATRGFWFHAVGRWLAAVHHQPLYCPNDVVWAPRGGNIGSAESGGAGENGGGGDVTYLHCSAAFLLIKTPICVFEVHNESVWLRGGTGRK